MSLECSECERDLRGGHAETCSRYRKPCEPSGVGEGLREALKQWKCPACNGTRFYSGYSAKAPKGTPCRKCKHTDGLHPIAYAALAASAPKPALCNAPNRDGSYLCNEEPRHSGSHVHSFIRDGERDFYWWDDAPKPAPPAEPPFQAICGVEPANGIVNHYIAVICYLPEDKFKNGDQVRVTVEPVRRAAERKP